MTTLASCGTSSTATRQNLRETLAIDPQTRSCFEKKVEIPAGSMSRKQVLDLLKRLYGMDGEKSACGRALILRYDTLLDEFFDGDKK